MFTHAMDFFKECVSLKKSIPKSFFTNLFSDLLTNDLVMFGNLFSTKFMKPRKQLYATLSKQTWVPPKLKNKMLKPQMSYQMIGPTPKPQKVYDS